MYLAITGGQTSLSLDEDDTAHTGALETRVRISSDRAPLRIIEADEEELDAHKRRLIQIDKESGGKCLWLQMES